MKHSLVGVLLTVIGCILIANAYGYLPLQEVPAYKLTLNVDESGVNVWQPINFHGKMSPQLNLYVVLYELSSGYCIGKSSVGNDGSYRISFTPYYPGTFSFKAIIAIYNEYVESNVVQITVSGQPKKVAKTVKCYVEGFEKSGVELTVKLYGSPPLGAPPTETKKGASPLTVTYTYPRRIQIYASVSKPGENYQGVLNVYDCDGTAQLNVYLRKVDSVKPPADPVPPSDNGDTVLQPNSTDPNVNTEQLITEQTEPNYRSLYSLNNVKIYVGIGLIISGVAVVFYKKKPQS